MTGQWLGVSILTGDRKNALEHVKVMHAGGGDLDSRVTTAVFLRNDAYLSLKNSEVSMSGAHGLHMQFRNSEIDFEKNVFTKKRARAHQHGPRVRHHA